MGIISNIINNKVTQIKRAKFLENINNLIAEAEKQKKDLYLLNNNYKSKLFDCTKLSELLSINIEVPSTYFSQSDKIDENTIGYFTNFRTMDEIDKTDQELIKRFNSIIDDVYKSYIKISKNNDVLEDIKCYMNDKEIPISYDSLVKFGFSKNGNPFCLLCDFGNKKTTSIRGLEVDIFYGKFHERKDYYLGKGFMQMGVDIIDIHPSIEIQAFDVRTKEKRTGIGSSTLKWLEETIIPEINRRIDHFNHESKSEEDDIELYHIEEIHGCSGDLSSDTDSDAREKFYTKNGYLMCGNMFRKTLKSKNVIL
jgi:hypothetical protein